MPAMSALPYPRSATAMTRTPIRSAMRCEPSVLPLSATTISPQIWCSTSACWAARMHDSSVSASFRQGITIVISGWSSGAPVMRAVSSSRGKAVMTCRFGRETEASRVRTSRRRCSRRAGNGDSRDERVQRSTENPRRGPRIKIQILPPFLDAETGLGEQLQPLRARLVIVGQRHTMRRVANPIHETQDGRAAPAIGEVILDHHPLPDHSRHLPQYGAGVGCVMQHIHEHDDIEAGIGEGEVQAVVLRRGNRGDWTDQDIHSLDTDVGPRVGDGPGNRAVAGPHIEDARALRDATAQMVAQDAHATRHHVTPVHAANDAGHLRLNPRMLKKKLDRTVWNPSAVSVTPGMTQRMVRS